MNTAIRTDAAANRLTVLCEYFETRGEWPHNRSDSSDIADLRAVLDRLKQLEQERNDDTRAVRKLTQDASSMLGDWAEANAPYRAQLWRDTFNAADGLFNRFRERFAELDKLAARDGQADAAKPCVCGCPHPGIDDMCCCPEPCPCSPCDYCDTGADGIAG